MKIVAIMPVRNEQWILGLSARVALEWCDQLICLLHRSTDASKGILEELAGQTERVIWSVTQSERWMEMEHRQFLLDLARNYEATHIALIDADEILCGDSLLKVRTAAAQLRPGQCLNANMYCMWRGLDQYRVDPGSVWSNRRDLALVFCDEKRLEFTARDGYQHHARAPRGSKAVYDPALGVMHLQFADWNRLTAKHALYKVRERCDYPQKPVSMIESLYNLALDERGLQTHHTPGNWLAPYWDKRWGRYVDFFNPPWQAGEARRLYAEHEPSYFHGLNLFGVCQ